VEYSYQRPGEAMATDSINGSITNNFSILSVTNKIPDLSKQESGMCPINAKKADDIKHVMKYIDHDHNDFFTSILEWETTSKDDQDE
jgi:hypothetical protein